LVLQVVVEAEAFVGEMLADADHVEIGAVASAELLREGVTQVAGTVGPAAHLAEQLLPLLARDAAVVPVGTGVLAPVVEELDVLLFERLDLSSDEVVELVQELPKLLGDLEVHEKASLSTGSIGRLIRFNACALRRGIRRVRRAGGTAASGGPVGRARAPVRGSVDACAARTRIR